MRALFGGIAVALIAAIVAGCSREPSSGGVAEGVEIGCTVKPEPPVVGTATVDVTLADDTGDPLAAAEVRVEGNMNHAGMVPSIATAHEVERGLYRADLELTMGGDWFVTVQATLADGRRVERTFPLPAVRRR